MEIIRDRWSRDIYSFNKIISQMSFIADYKILYGISNIGDRLYMDNIPYKYYDDINEFIEDGLKEFETCPKPTDMIAVQYKVFFRPDYDCQLKEFVRDFQNYWKYYYSTGKSYMDDLYVWDKDNKKLGRILLGINVPFRFKDDIVNVYNEIFNKNEKAYDEINARTQNSQRQPKFVQWIIHMYKKQGVDCPGGYWIKPYGYTSYFTASNEDNNHISVLFYLDNKDKNKLNYKDIAEFTLNYIIPRMIDGLGWDGVLKHDAYIAFCCGSEYVNVDGMKKDVQPICIEEETGKKVSICFTDGVYTKDIQHKKRRTLVPYRNAAENELLQILDNTIYK